MSNLDKNINPNLILLYNKILIKNRIRYHNKKQNKIKVLLYHNKKQNKKQNKIKVLLYNNKIRVI